MPDIIHILQLGHQDYAAGIFLPDNVRWHYSSPDALLATIETLKEEKLEQLKKSQSSKKQITSSVTLWFDGLLITEQIDESCLEILSDMVEAHTVFYDKPLMISSSETGFLHRKMARLLDLTSESTHEEIVYFLWNTLFKGQYGDKLTVSDCDVLPGFSGTVSLQGHSSLTLEGNFGSKLSPLLTFRYGIPMETIATEVWWEFVTEGSIEVTLYIDKLYSGAIDGIKETIILTQDDLSCPYLILPDPEVNQCNVTVYAKGEGKLMSGPLHRRFSRRGLGHFLAGGKRHVDEKRQEVFTYFNPGDMKPPLMVYFSGFRGAEGFEGFYMMKNMKSPFVLVTDPRLEGGCFYLGTQTYETAIISAISEALDYLSFDTSQLILSGLSMGTYGALYYASDFNPRAIIVGKPFTNIGDTAMNMRLNRPDEFETSADMLLNLVGDNDEIAAEQINQQFWKKFKRSRYLSTQFAIAYMKDDDYDQKAYQRLLKYVSDKDIHIYGKGYSGRHNDNSDAINKWFLDQYRRLLRKDFGRNL